MHTTTEVVTVCPLDKARTRSGLRLARRSVRQDAQWKLAPESDKLGRTRPHTMIGHRHPHLFTQNTVVACGLEPVPVVHNIYLAPLQRPHFADLVLKARCVRREVDTRRAHHTCTVPVAGPCTLLSTAGRALRVLTRLVVSLSVCAAPLCRVDENVRAIASGGSVSARSSSGSSGSSGGSVSAPDATEGVG